MSPDPEEGTPESNAFSAVASFSKHSSFTQSANPLDEFLVFDFSSSDSIPPAKSTQDPERIDGIIFDRIPIFAMAESPARPLKQKRKLDDLLNAPPPPTPTFQPCFPLTPDPPATEDSGEEGDRDEMFNKGDVNHFALSQLLAYVKVDNMEQFKLGVIQLPKSFKPPEKYPVSHPDSSVSFISIQSTPSTQSTPFFVFDTVCGAWVQWDVSNPCMQSLRTRESAGYRLALLDESNLPPRRFTTASVKVQEVANPTYDIPSSSPLRCRSLLPSTAVWSADDPNTPFIVRAPLKASPGVLFLPPLANLPNGRRRTRQVLTARLLQQCQNATADFNFLASTVTHQGAICLLHDAHSKLISAADIYFNSTPTHEGHFRLLQSFQYPQDVLCALSWWRKAMTRLPIDSHDGLRFLSHYNQHNAPNPQEGEVFGDNEGRYVPEEEEKEESWGAQEDDEGYAVMDAFDGTWPDN